MLSSGWFTSTCSLNANISENCVRSIFIGLCLCLLCGASRYPPNVLQLTEPYCTNPTLVSLLHLQRRSTSYDVRGLYQRRMELWARNVRSNLAYNSTSAEIVGFFYVPQICDMGPMALLPLRRKACWGIFRPKKSDGFGWGLNPRTWVSEASMLTTRPLRLLSS
jgi:hypothetical protein